jgi:hypothetical protein
MEDKGDTTSTTTSRRHLLRGLAAGAAGAAAASVAGVVVARPAAAADGDPLTLGALSTHGFETDVNYSGPTLTARAVVNPPAAAPTSTATAPASWGS